MRPETLEQLRKISMPRQFPKEEYICYEGQLGNEMYIILKGEVGVFVTNPIGTLNQVATIGVGDFFGEMAIFDNLPRSASCIALEETIAVAVTKENLDAFLATCPEIAGQMLEKMSKRIRRLNTDLYKNNRLVKNRHVPRFELPLEHKEGHMIRAPKAREHVLIQYKQACPICAKAVSVTDVKRNILTERSFGVDCRMTYEECNTLWYEVISCPHCYYTNHYLRFFGINNFEYELVQDILRKEHWPIVESRIAKRGDYDYLVMHYLQAIHINEYVDAGNGALIGGLWRNLYWLAKEGNEPEFSKYCAKKAIEKYKWALDENQVSDKDARAFIAMTLVGMMMFCNDNVDMMKYAIIAGESSDVRIRNNAMRVKEKLERQLYNE